jgi:signal transduction histidine kinase
MSVRLQLTLWYAAVLSVALALFGGLLYFSLEHRMLSEIDRELNGTSMRFAAYFIRESRWEPEGRISGELEEFCQGLPPSFSIQLRGSNGFTFRHNTSGRLLADVREVRREFTAQQNTFVLETSASLADLLLTMKLLRILLFSLTPVVILVACAAGAWMSRRALKPVHEIAAAALTIGIENLSQRLPVPKTKDEIARLSEVLNTMFARLESAVKTLSLFVADASHELRTPLAVIRATAEVSLRKERSAESYRTSLAEIVSESERMTGLVDDLLTLARSDTQAAEMPLVPLDANDAGREVCTEMLTLAHLRQIRLESHSSPRPAIIAANHSALRRLFLVLLDNAFKFSHPGGCVRFTVHSDVWEVRVSIEDQGIGIDPESRAHIFKRFYRGDPAHTGPGHGLGLSLAESIAKAHGATIEVESTEGAGSRFDVIFPVRGAAASKAASGNLQIPPLPSFFADSRVASGEGSTPQ